jgi:tetratricopeptide (TPR) repeat protein
MGIMNTRQSVSLGLIILLCASAALAQERFKWSWEDDGKGGKRRKATSVATPAPAEATAPGAPAPKSTLGPSAYDDLLNENMQLRKQIGQQKKDLDLARGQSARLSRDMKGMDQRVTQMTTTLQRLQGERDVAVAKASQKLPEPPVVVTPKSIDDDLQDEIKALRAVVADLKTQRPPPPETTESVSPDSVLYKELEHKNVLLQDKLVDVDGDRTKAVQLCEQLKRRYERTLAQTAESQRALRVEIAELKTTVAEREAVIRVRAKEVDMLESALEKERRRASLAVQAFEKIEENRSDVQLSQQEKRDHHYNMAIVYAKEGKFREAEAEYKAALNVDPGDPDIHYNLGILYDDDLRQPDKALTHYDRYLKLRPDAPDADTVSEWIMRIKMRRQF